jgi:hypothetical protein
MTDDDGGYELDLDVGIGAKLALSIESLADKLQRQMDEQARREQRAAALIPIVRPMVGSGIMPASGDLYFSIGKAELGRQLELRSLSVGGPQWTDTPAGTGALIAAAAFPPSDLSILNLRDIISEALPQVAFYSSNQVTCQHGEHLVVVIAGGTSGLQYAAAGIALDYPVRAAIRAEI